MIKIRHKYAFIFLFQPIIAVAANDLPIKVIEAFKKNDINLNNISISVVHLGGETEAKKVLSFNENISRNPASTMKILTSAAALEVLKPDYNWVTKFFSDNRNGNTLGGKIYADLQGDPKFVPEILLPMLHKWKAEGIKNIDADFVLNNAIFSKNPDSSSDDESNEVYAVKPQADNFAFNSVTAKFNGEEVKLNYPIYGVRLNNNLVLTNELCPNNKTWGNNINYSIKEADGIYLINLTGKYSKFCSDKSFNMPISNYISNKDFFVRSLLGLWASIEGNIIKYPNISYGEVSKNSVLIGEILSFPLAALIYDMNKFSNNLMARLIFLRLGIMTQPNHLNAELSRKTVLNYLKENNIDSYSIVLENGSGLSQLERISAKQMTDILGLAYSKPFFKNFLESLPIAGVDGTMKNRLQDISGKAWLKSGTLNNVRAIAGYISDGKGGFYAVSAMVNEENAGRANPALDELVRHIASLNTE